MAEDALTKAAKALTDTEAEVLGMFARNISSGDIAIQMETLSRTEVVNIIRTRGSDNRNYAHNLMLARARLAGVPPRQERAQAVAASRPPARALGATQIGEDFITSSISYAGNPRGLRTLPASPRPAADPAPKAAPAKAVLVKKAPTAKAVAKKAAAVAAPATIKEPDPVVDEPTEQEQQPAGPVPETPVEQQPVPDAAEPSAPDAAAVPAVAETYEELLRRAEQTGNADLQTVATGLRFELERLSQALDVQDKAQGLRAKVVVLEEEIAERVARRDALKAEIERLMASDVMVSAASGSLRRPPR